MFKFFLLLLICCLTLSECERVFYFGDIVGKSLMTYQTMWKRRIKYPEHSEPYEFIVENSDVRKQIRESNSFSLYLWHICYSLSKDCAT